MNGANREPSARSRTTGAPPSAVEPATILRSAAADLAHLLAELIENARVLAPDQTVDIRGAAQSSGQPGGYTLAVVDSGLGMPPADIAGSTGASPAPNRSPSPPPSTWATTSPATSPPATTSPCTCTAPPAPASPRPSSCRPTSSPPTPACACRGRSPPRPALARRAGTCPRRCLPRPAVSSRAPAAARGRPGGPDSGPASQTDAHMASSRTRRTRPRRAAPGRACRPGPRRPRRALARRPALRPGESGNRDALATGAHRPRRGRAPPLTRRDRGAQMPMTTPHSVRRTPPADAALGGPSPEPPPPPSRSTGSWRASRAGVQRASRRRPRSIGRAGPLTLASAALAPACRPRGSAG